MAVGATKFRLNICALTCLDYAEQASRCLESIVRQVSENPDVVSDVRIAVNRGTERNIALCRGISLQLQSLGVTSYVYLSDSQFKYPTMRRLFHDPARPLADAVMWFDDDSYIDAAAPATWLGDVTARASECDMLGQRWHLPVRGNRAAFIRAQPWYNPQVEMKLKTPFCQGAWWVLRSSRIAQFNWPIPELKHCGGDSLLGELARHQRFNIQLFDEYLHINADELGRHSKAARRGYTEKELGVVYDPKIPIDTSHQNVTVVVEEALCTK